MSLDIIIQAVTAFLGALVGAGTMYFGLIKLRPEIKHLNSETRQTEAETAGSWAQSNELAAKQILQLQQDVMTLRGLLKESIIKINALEIQDEIKGERIKRLESQIHSMGMEPVK